MFASPSLRARLAAAAVVSTLAVVIAAPVSAAPNGVVTVTGASQSKIELNLSDTEADFGTTLTPDGDASNSSDSVSVLVDGDDPSVGACYVWGGDITVRSNVGYHVTAAAGAAHTRLDLLTADPADYEDCTGGESLATAMFTSATPAGAWVTGQTRTSERSHDFWLGLDVRWADEPSSTLANATLTLTATAAS